MPPHSANLPTRRVIALSASPGVYCFYQLLCKLIFSINRQVSIRSGLVLRRFFKSSASTKKTASMSPQCSHFSSSTAEELENEIAVLELEVLKLERYLLSRYQEIFGNYLSASSKNHGEDKSRQINFDGPRSLSTFSTHNKKVNHLLEDSPKFSSGRLSLAEYLVSSPVVDASSLACKLSEDIIRCMSSIYIKLSDANYPSSSSISANGLYEVVRFSIDAEKFNSVAPLMQQFKSLVLRLENINPKKMDNEEKLAFWINIHNALVMHAFLAYGPRRSYMRTPRSIMKAAYKIGGSSVRVDEIKKNILRCQPINSELTQRLGALILRFGKFHDVEEKHPYRLIESNPLVCFALCRGAYSDPPVRVYSSKNIVKELEKARNEFLLANVSVHKEGTILLPRLLMRYTKMASMDLPCLLNIVHESILEPHRQDIKRCISRHPNKSVRWLPDQSHFRYLIQEDIVRE